MRFLKLILLFSISACGAQEKGVNFEPSNVNECENSGSSNCVNDTASSFLSMAITSANPQIPFSAQGDCLSNETLPDPDPFNKPAVNLNRLYCYDISGTCNEGKNASASVIIVNPPKFIKTPLHQSLVSNVIAECIRGRFRAQIAADFGPEPDNVLCQTHTLEFELIGKSINDEEEKNPSQARKFMDIRANAHYNCNNN